MGIRDIHGVYCPMGCGETLHLMQSGTILCLAPKCPQPDAAQKILSDREAEHLVEFSGDGFTVRHPLRERIGDELMSCEVHRRLQDLGPFEGLDGWHQVILAGDGLDFGHRMGPGSSV